MLEECIALMRELDDRFGLAWALHAESLLNMKEGRLDAARASIVESLRLFVAADDISGIAIVLTDSASLAALSGDLDQAVRIFSAAEKVRDESGVLLANLIESWQMPAVDLIRGAASRLVEAREEGRRLSRDAAIALVLGVG